MALLDELMGIEHRLANGGGDEYRGILAEDALVIVPGAVLDKPACVSAMEESPGWDTVTLESARLLEEDGIATVVYRFRGVRGDFEYRATLSSTYRLPERELVLHQQTPDPEA